MKRLKQRLLKSRNNTLVQCLIQTKRFLRETKDKLQLRWWLRQFSDSQAFYDYIAQKQRKNPYMNSLFRYGKLSGENFEALYKALNINFHGSSILDLGTGYGQSLDIAKSMGAEKLEFVEYSPCAYVFNQLKGYTGYFFNYIVPPGLTRLHGKKYDFILSKGGINADRANRNERDNIPFDIWIGQVESLLASNGTIVICPTFDKGTATILHEAYVCSDPKAFLESQFSQTLKKRGYEIRTIEKFNDPVEKFPFTFVKRFGAK